MRENNFLELSGQITQKFYQKNGIIASKNGITFKKMIFSQKQNLSFKPGYLEHNTDHQLVNKFIFSNKTLRPGLSTMLIRNSMNN